MPLLQISEAFRRYGVSDDTAALLVIRIDTAIPDIRERMHAVVQGNMVPLSNLSQVTDWARVKKVRPHISSLNGLPHPLGAQTHKLNNEIAVREVSGDIEREHAVIDEIVISSVAMKSVMA